MNANHFGDRTMQRSVAFTEELSQYLVPGGVILSPARITAASAIAAP
jgi:hypothetical protein